MGLLYLRDVTTLTLSRDCCTGCGRCVEVCPHDVFTISDGRALIKARDRCMECGACALNCPFDCIKVDSGVGCAAAIVSGLLAGTPPACGCDDKPKKGSACC